MYGFVQDPVRHPQKCICCGAGPSVERVWWLDLGEDTNSPDELMITIYVCCLCFTVMAQDQGIVPRAPLDSEIEDLKAKLFNAEVVADGLTHGLDGLLRARFISPADPGVSDMRSLLEAPDAGEDSESPAGNRVANGAGNPPESGHGSNVDGVSTGFGFDGGRP